MHRTNGKNQDFDQFSFVHAESDFLQLSEPSYMETTTTEEDPETQERYFLVGRGKEKKKKKKERKNGGKNRTIIRIANRRKSQN